jgi:uncharacterized protein GlcG (DUF336 family)
MFTSWPQARSKRVECVVVCVIRNVWALGMRSPSDPMKYTHISREPVESRVALEQRRKTLAAGVIPAIVVCASIVFLIMGCGSGNVSPVTPVPPSPVVTLSAVDVDNIVQAAAKSAAPTTMVIAIVDRPGNVLAVYRKPGATTTLPGNFGDTVDANDLAIALARTGAFFSNNQAPLTSRTVRFISGIHFPPGVTHALNAALYGIENTNRGCTLSPELEANGIHPSTSINGGPGPGIMTGKADLNDSDANAVNPGGLAIYKGSVVVGGIGVAGVSPDVAEFAAFSGASSNGFSAIPVPLPAPGAVFLDGVILPNIKQTMAPAGIGPGTFAGAYKISPIAGSAAPEGDLVAAKAGPVGGLSAAEVKQILDHAEATANQTRAGIRLPLGSRARMVIAIADLDGTIIGLRRMSDSTVFSIDVAATKARNMVYFNSAARTAADLNQVPVNTSVTNRTISFGAQPLFPPGIDGSPAGPFFNIYMQDKANPCTQAFQPGAPNVNKSGIIFFPGSEGLYRNGTLIAGLGVSGDGVEQDDYVTAGGAAGFEPQASIRADQVLINGVRLPYFKFPRNPTN